MARDLGFSSPDRVFRCTACQEYINDSMNSCPYCGAVVDSTAAQAAANIQDKTNKASNDTNFLKIMASTMLLFYVLSWVPFRWALFIRIIGGTGFIILLVAGPFFYSLWWVKKYGTIKTDDPGYKQARRNAMLAMKIWGGMFVLYIIGIIVAWAL